MYFQMIAFGSVGSFIISNPKPYDSKKLTGNQDNLSVVKNSVSANTLVVHRRGQELRWYHQLRKPTWF